MQFTVTCVVLWTLLTVTNSRARDLRDETPATSPRDPRVPSDHVVPTPARASIATGAATETSVVYATLHANYSLNNEENGGLQLSDLYPTDMGRSPGDHLVTEEEGEVPSGDVWKKRMRAKNLRVFLIQTEILRALGLKKQPNITRMPVSHNDRMVIDRYLDPGPEPDQNSGLVHRYHFTLPSCELPHKTHRSWRDPAYFRLYFTPKPLEDLPLIDFQMASAVLRLHKKGPIDCSCDSHTTTTEAPTARPRAAAKLRSGRGSGKEGTSGRRQSTREQARRRADRGRRKHNSSRRSSTQKHRLPVTEKPRQIKITVNFFKKPVKKNKTAKKQMSTSQLVDRDHVGWVEVDIKQLVRRWLKRPGKNYGIEIHVEDEEQSSINPNLVFDNINCTSNSDYNDLLFGDPDSEQESNLLNQTMEEGGFNLTMPNLETTLVEVPRPQARRHRRHIAQAGAGEERGQGACVKETTFVSFEELGLSEWVVAPLGIEASYCRGHCNHVSKHLTQHDATPRSNKTKQNLCCGPTKWKSFVFLHQAEPDTLTMSSLDNFLVAECGYRE